MGNVWRVIKKFGFWTNQAIKPTTTTQLMILEWELDRVALESPDSHRDPVTVSVSGTK